MNNLKDALIKMTPSPNDLLLMIANSYDKSLASTDSYNACIDNIKNTTMLMCKKILIDINKPTDIYHRYMKLYLN